MAHVLSMLPLFYIFFTFFLFYEQFIEFNGSKNHYNPTSMNVSKLQQANITNFHPIFSKLGSFSKKVLATLNNSSQSIAKVITRNSQTARGTILTEIEVNDTHQLQYDAFNTLYQGAQEILSYHMDQVLGFHRVPTTVGRNLSREELDQIDPYALTLYFRLSEEQTSIAFSLQNLLENIESRAPSCKDFDCLTLRSDCDLSSSKRLRDISDIIVFDFMIDNHDRKEAKNWVVDKTDNYIPLDNGLAWKYGPYPTPKTHNILCDWSSTWEQRKEDLPDYWMTCDKVCVFSNSTYHRLKALAHADLGKLLLKSVKSDFLHPLFELLQYEDVSIDESLHALRLNFPSKLFSLGSNIRLQQLIHHIENCVKRYGDTIALQLP